MSCRDVYFHVKLDSRRLEPYQRVAIAALLSVIVLIFVGAIVRATGAGLGCPDWPFCWGCYVPPTSVEQVDFEKIDVERFKRKVARLGQDPDTVTEDSLRAMFNPIHVWTEYINRLTSLPVGLFTLAAAFMSVGQWSRGRRLVGICGWLSLVVVLVNAWLGRNVVLSGLKPGIITTHMGLAIFLLGLLVYMAWRGTDRPWTLSLQAPARKKLQILIVVLLGLTIFEGLMGSQVREMTDHLAKTHMDEPRSAWTVQLEQTWMYLVHRSFSWVILGAAIWFYFLADKALPRGCRWLEKAILGLIVGQMCLGLVLSQVGILAIAQILHIGLSSLLISSLVLWIFGVFATRDERIS